MQLPQHTKDLNTWADEMGTSSRTLMRLFKNKQGYHIVAGYSKCILHWH